MTTLLQLPLANTTNATDLLLLEQQQSTNAVTLQTLLAGTQAKLTLASGTLLGRVGVFPGSPEPVGIGTGLALQSGTLTVDQTLVAPLANPAFTGSPTAPTPASNDSSNALATTAFVQSHVATMSVVGDVVGSGVGTITLALPAITAPGTFSKVTVNAKGQVTSGGTLAGADVTAALGYTPASVTTLQNVAPLASPSFTGKPTAPTALASDNSTAIATTAFVQAHASPLTLTGDMVGSGTGTVAVALPAITTAGTYAKVTVNAKGQVTSGGTLAASDVTGALGFTPMGTASLQGLASLTSPAFTGTPTAPTATASDNSNTVATTAFVQAHTGALTLTGDVVGSGNGTLAATLPAITTAGTFAKVTVNAKGQVTSGGTLAASDVTGALGFTPVGTASLQGLASLTSPAFSGTPTAPTAIASDNSNTVATTAFVQAHTGALTLTGDVVGSGNGTLAATLPAITTAGTYAKVTVNAKGQVTSGGTLAASDVTGALGFTPVGTASLQGLASLTSPAFTGTPTAPTAIASDNSNTVATTAFVQAHTGALTLTGDVVGSGNGTLAATLPAITTAGTFGKVTVNAKGQVTSGGTLAAADVSGALGFTPVSAPALSTFPARNYGAYFDGVHDDAPGINAAIAAANAAGGGIVLLPVARGRLGSSIVQPYSNVQLVGAGIGLVNFNSAPGYQSTTSLVWVGALGGTMMVVGPQQAATPPYRGTRASNADVRGVMFDCNSIAAIGLQIQSVAFSRFEVSYNEPNQCGVLVTTAWLNEQTSATVGAAEVNDPQQNRFDMIAGSISRSWVNTKVATTVPGGGTTVPITSNTGFVTGMRVLIGTHFYIVASAATTSLTLTTAVSQADATAGNVVGFAPRGVYCTAQNVLPSGYTTFGGPAYPQLWIGNTSLNQFGVVYLIHYPYGGAAFAFGYSDHNRVEKLTAFTLGGAYPSVGLELEGSNVAALNGSCNNQFEYCGTANVVCRGTTTFTYPSLDTVIRFFDTQNNTTPVVETGSNLVYYDDHGNCVGAKSIREIVGVGPWDTSGYQMPSTTSLAVVNENADHIRIATNTGGAQWGISLDQTSSLRFLPIGNAGSILLGSDVYGLSLTSASSVTGSSLRLQTPNTVSPIVISGPAATPRYVEWDSGSSTRWQLGCEEDPETGSNAGSPLVIRSWADNGGFLGTWILINRATGATSINSSLTVAGTTIVPTPPAGDNSTKAATTAWVVGQNYLTQVPTIAALRAVSAAALADGATMQVDAYAVRGDGGTGLFVWNAASTSADNGGSVIAPTGSSGAGRWLRQLADGRLTPQMFGAKGDGVTNDTAAFNAALAAGPVVVPSATYVVSGVTVPNGAWMEGGAGLGYSGDIGTGTPGTGQKAAVVSPVLIAKAGTTSCILNVNGCNDATLKGFFLDGVSTSCDGISSGSTQLMMERVTVVRCVNGLGATSTSGYSGLTDLYTHVATLINCEFANCTNGISNLIDSAMLGGAASANVVGVNLGSGANANSFLGARFEWNSQDGVQGYGSASNTFTGGLFDRNSWRAVNLGAGCYDFTFTGVQFARNGVANAYPNNSHIALNGTTSVFFNGCVSRTGTNDNGTGTLSPAYFVNYINTNALVTITGCDVSGYTTGFAFGSNPTAYVQRDNDGAGDSFVNAARPYVGNGVAAQTLITKAAANIAPGQSTTIAIGQSPLTNNYSVTARELVVTATNFNSPYQSCSARFNLSFYRDTAVHAPSASAAYGEAGGTGLITWGGSGKLQLSAASVASDGSSWTLGLLNGGTGDGSNWGIWAELR